MAKGKLWEFAVLFHPKMLKDNAGNDVTPPSVKIVPRTEMLAATEKEVALKGARAIPADYEDRLEDCEVLVRPF